MVCRSLNIGSCCLVFTRLAMMAWPFPGHGLLLTSFEDRHLYKDPLLMQAGRQRAAQCSCRPLPAKASAGETCISDLWTTLERPIC